MSLKAVSLAVAALCGTLVGLLWQQRQAQADNNKAAAPAATRKQPRKQQPRSAPTLPDATTSTSNTTTQIPEQELKALQSFLRRVYRWRGWQGGVFHLTQAWHAVQTAATTEPATAGGWTEQFTGKQLTDANCDALLRLIDREFFGGKLLRRLQTAAAGGPAAAVSDSNDGAAMTTLAATGNATGSAEAEVSSPAAAAVSPQPQVPGKMRCRVVQSWDAQWVAYFDTQDNVVYINCWRWSKSVSPDAPINCEGVVCTNRLQMLMHTLAHELVHAVVFHLFPDIDEHSPAYTANSRHGPIFHLLNKQLFGHTSDALEHVRVLPSSCTATASHQI